MPYSRRQLLRMPHRDLARRHAPVALTQLEEALRDFDPAYVRFGVKTGSALVEHKISA